MMPSALELAIFRTIAYFNYSDYPLTAFEIWKWLLEPDRAYSLGEVIETLDASLWLKAKISSQSGFHGLGSVDASVENRRSRLANALKKYAKLKRLATILGRVPYVDGIAVCNSLAFHHTLPTSDIDLFIIAREGRIWTTRLLAALPLMLLKERPGERAEDPICLSFFATPSAFSFEPLKIGEQDPYLAYWIQSLIPLVDRTGWHRAFREANPWADRALPNAYGVKRAGTFRLAERRPLPVAPLSEELAERMQEERFPEDIRQLRNRDTRVIISPTMLKFHAHDRRAEILAALNKHVETV